MNLEIIKIILKEFGWYLLIYCFSTFAAYLFFLLLESVGFVDSLDTPAANFYGLSPPFFLANLIAFDLALLFFAVLRTDIEKDQISDWKNEVEKLPIYKIIGFGILGAIGVLLIQYLEISALSPIFSESELTKTDWDETKGFGLKEKVILLIYLTTISPFIIEFYLREAMLGSIYRRNYPYFAVIFPGLFLCFLNFDYLHILGYLMTGILLGLIYLQTRSLIPTVIATGLAGLISFYRILFP